MIDLATPATRALVLIDDERQILRCVSNLTVAAGHAASTVRVRCALVILGLSPPDVSGI